MSYYINQFEEAMCAFVTHDGTMSLAETAAAQQDVAELLAAKRWNRIIVNVTAMQSVPKGAEVFGLGKSLSRSLPRSVRIALVVRQDQAKHARLIEQLARKGGTFLTYFIDAQKAEVWVRRTPPLMHNAHFEVPQHPGVEPTKAMRGDCDA